MNLVDTTKAAFLDEVDWDALNRRLCVYAYKLADGMPGVFDGISPEDLVGEAITAFYADPEGLGWDPYDSRQLGKVSLRRVEEQVHDASAAELESRGHSR